MGYQQVFKRYEVKYVITRRQQQIIESAFQGRMEPDTHGRSTICSLYYDTPDKALIRRSIEGPVYKEKLRVRSYGVASHDSTVFVELKKKYQHVVYKRRVSMSVDEAARYLQNNLLSVSRTQVISEIDYFKSFYGRIVPSAFISYERAAHFAIDDPSLRITFDENIMWRDTDLSMMSGAYGHLLMDGELVLMEVKTSLGLPLWLTKVLTEQRIFRRPFSKYGMAYKTTIGNSRGCLSA